MVVRMRSTRGHTGNRRSHHALKTLPLTKCAKCGATTWRHRACLSCGTYRGREIMDTMAKVVKKQAKAKKQAVAKN